MNAKCLLFLTSLLVLLIAYNPTIFLNSVDSVQKFWNCEDRKTTCVIKKLYITREYPKIGEMISENNIYHDDIWTLQIINESDIYTIKKWGSMSDPVVGEHICYRGAYRHPPMSYCSIIDF